MRFSFFLHLTTLIMMLSALSWPCGAADSRWLLCDNGKLAINLLEHRSADGQGRVTSLTLLLGGNILNGQLANADSGRVMLSSLLKDKSSFRGNIAVNHQKNLVSLKGTLNLDGDLFKLNAQLQCKALRSSL